jgi:hypothetical protein
MATTTNYGWTTPDNTALVKDGASAIRTLGSSIDTTLKAQIDAQIPDTLLTTTGDVIYASAANTPARLGIGSTGNVLTVSGGLPTWAAPSSGGMTSIASGSLSGASLSLSSIPSGYVDLVLYIRGAQGSGANQITMTINGVTGGSNYGGGTLTSSYTERVSAGFIAASGGNAIANSTFMSVRFFDYLNSHSGIINTVNSSSAATGNRSFNFFSDTNQNAITSVTVSVSGANWTAGTYILYGVK